MLILSPCLNFDLFNDDDKSFKVFLKIEFTVALGEDNRT